jgi:mono/diheme cytochrome c family protein
MKQLKKQVAALLLLASVGTLVLAQTLPPETRGDLLYSTYCVTCHTTQVHWRNDRKAFDWDSLMFQVRRWQGNTGLAWSDADITEVARYLNETYYSYPRHENRAELVQPRKAP